MDRQRQVIVMAFIVISFIQPALARKDDYPKTLQERKIEEMGSVVGGEGLVFTPSKIKKESTKATVENSAVNKYLWKAALETLKDMPLMNADAANGLVLTDWHSSKDMPGFSYKVEVFVKDDVISPEALEVKVFEKAGNKEPREAGDLKASFEDRILRKARELYIMSLERK